MMLCLIRRRSGRQQPLVCRLAILIPWGAPARVQSATAAAPACTVAPANAVPERTALGRDRGARARRPLSMDRDLLQPNARTATGGEASDGSGKRCRRQLTLADFWR